jgi:hypothetical protein
MNQALKCFQMTAKEYAYIINNKYLESVNEYIKMRYDFKITVLHILYQFMSANTCYINFISQILRGEKKLQLT